MFTQGHTSGGETDPEDIRLVNSVDSACHLPNSDVHTPVVRLRDKEMCDERMRDRERPRL